jgi:hypothetical protein
MTIEDKQRQAGALMFELKEARDDFTHAREMVISIREKLREIVTALDGISTDYMLQDDVARIGLNKSQENAMNSSALLSAIRDFKELDSKVRNLELRKLSLNL